jgi:hypothetical protein
MQQNDYHRTESLEHDAADAIPVYHRRVPSIMFRGRRLERLEIWLKLSALLADAFARVIALRQVSEADIARAFRSIKDCRRHVRFPFGVDHEIARNRHRVTPGRKQ